MKQENKFYVGITFEPILSQRIDALRMKMEDKFGLKKARKNPPHLTLIPPFKTSTEVVDLWIPQVLKTPSFNCTLANFGFFDKNRVAFIKVNEHENFLTLRKEIAQRLNQWNFCKGKRFSPHVTIATKDLNSQKMKWVKMFLSHQNFEENTKITEVTVWKLVEEHWEKYLEFPLSTPL